MSDERLVWVRLLGPDGAMEMLEIPEEKATRLIRRDKEIYCFCTLSPWRENGAPVLDYYHEAVLTDI